MSDADAIAAMKRDEATARAEPAPEPLELRFVSLDEFVADEEPGASAFVGDDDNVLVPEGGDVMFYGDGGAGKTTLLIDLALHLAAGDDWLGISIARPVRVAIVEDEGPRPLFRAKLRRKLRDWEGSPIGGRLLLLEEPWNKVSLDSPAVREALAQKITEHELDALIVGPVTRSGMNEAGTLQQVRDYVDLVADVREASGRRATFLLAHHENRGGQVSGAWEGAVDTLFHIEEQRNGRTRLHVQKARWSPEHHKTTLQLLWAHGEGFAVEEKTELDDEAIAEMILVAIRANPGTSWTRVEELTKGVRDERRREIRDSLLVAGRLVNIVRDDGVEVALDRCPERRPSRLYQADDLAIARLRPTPDADGTQAASARGAGDQRRLRPASRLIGTQEADADAAHPTTRADCDRDRRPLLGDDDYPTHLIGAAAAGMMTERELARALAAHEFVRFREAAA